MGCRLISIGLVDETGERQFDAELTDTYRSEHLSDFVRVAVVPLLEGGAAAMPMHELILKLGAWIENFEEEVVLVSDSYWDTGWIAEIFETPGTWPANLAVPQVPRFDSDAQHLRFNQLALHARKRHGLRFQHAPEGARANQIALRDLELA